MHVRQFSLDPPRGLDEGAAVIIVFLDAGRNGEDVGIEDDVLGRKTDLFRQQIVGPLANLEFALRRFRLTRFVERHHDHGRAVAQNLARVFQERRLAFLHADGVHHRLALHAFEPRLDHGPFGRIQHDGNARDIGLRRDQIEEGLHGLLRVQHALVHVDVDHVRAILDLLARDFERGCVVVGLDQFAEAGGPRDIGPLTNHHKTLRC